ncbi:hypothetical protein LTS18_004088 [Coniosporium uncinatum]|uniref:Uncharacterized protein n=1 Tax=Coniosporium uncinatum TaxID=93489 RepID=A0ACC3DBJ1_9PEZI|nr:hypothetical protein LTS18_004088 [Coniosporium uncinatum]
MKSIFYLAAFAPLIHALAVPRPQDFDPLCNDYCNPKCIQDDAASQCLCINDNAINCKDICGGPDATMMLCPAPPLGTSTDTSLPEPGKLISSDTATLIEVLEESLTVSLADAAATSDAIAVEPTTAGPEAPIPLGFGSAVPTESAVIEPSNIDLELPRFSALASEPDQPAFTGPSAGDLASASTPLLSTPEAETISVESSAAEPTANDLGNPLILGLPPGPISSIWTFPPRPAAAKPTAIGSGSSVESLTLRIKPTASSEPTFAGSGPSVVDLGVTVIPTTFSTGTSSVLEPTPAFDPVDPDYTCDEVMCTQSYPENCALPVQSNLETDFRHLRSRLSKDPRQIKSTKYECGSRGLPHCPDDKICVSLPGATCGPQTDCGGMCVARDSSAAAEDAANFTPPSVSKTNSESSAAQTLITKPALFYNNSTDMTANGTLPVNQTIPAPQVCGGYFENVLPPCPGGQICATPPSSPCYGAQATDCPGICVGATCGGLVLSPSPPCPTGQICANRPAHPQDVKDLPGMCVFADQTCGGKADVLAGRECPEDWDCVDYPNDGCEIARGAKDCGGICAFNRTLAAERY